MNALRWQQDALLMDLQIQPGAASDEIVGAHGERIRIRITAPPIDGRANAHLVNFLATAFGTSRSAVTVLRGAASRSKTVRIASPRQLPIIIAELLNIASARTAVHATNSPSRRR